MPPPTTRWTTSVTWTDQVRIPPQVGRYSVYIIDEVHMLSLQGLQRLSEDLGRTACSCRLYPATTEKHKIIPTILSRCQIYDFNRIRVEDTVGIPQIHRFAGGSEL